MPGVLRPDLSSMRFDDEIADGGAEPFVAKHKHNLSLL